MINFNKLPSWARWIARDSNGSWWVYEAEPHLHDNGWYENEIGRIQKASDISLDIQWQDSLTPIKLPDSLVPPPKP